MKKTLIFIVLFCLIIFSFMGFEEKGGTEVKKRVPISQELQDIIRMATLAPSSHNAQMWKLKIVNDNTILIKWDKSRKLASSDPENREALISIGAFIENFVEASKKYNFDVEVINFDKLQNDNSVAKIVLHEKKFDNTDTIIKNIEERHSIKIKFIKEDLKQKDLEKLLNINKDSISYFDLESEKGQYIKNAMYEANVKEALNVATQEELAEWVRVSDKETKTKRDGMSAEMFGIEGMKKYIYYAIIDKNSTKSKSFINSTTKKVKEQVENCSGYMVVTSNSYSLTDLINTGRELEKVLLKANELKVAVHTMSQVLHEEPWKSEFSGKLGLNVPVQMVLRVGYVKDYGKPNSLRRDIWEIIE